MTIGELLSVAEQGLAKAYPQREAKEIGRRLLEERLHIGRAEMYIELRRNVPDEQAAQVLRDLAQLEQMRPLQQVLGFADFYGLRLEVNEHTLIPRPETEELASWIIDEHRNAQSPVVVDLGTGSGCIAVTLAKLLPQANVYACDISQQALATARRNAQQHGVNISFAQLDMLHVSADVFPSDVSILVSNPPYVRDSEKDSMRANVLRYEPHSALFVRNDDPLVFYKSIARIGQHCLRSNGEIFMEVNEQLARYTAGVFSDAGFSDVVVRRDIFGRERMVRCRKK